MASVFAMIAKYDVSAYEKGDIITTTQDSNDFGVNIKNNPKFHIIEIPNTLLKEAEALVLPLMMYSDSPDLQQKVKARQLTVDVDKLLDKTQVSKEHFMSLLTRKDIPAFPQYDDVVIG